eukprot:365295-Chlamydomonas_euryale.AAC.7
MRDQVPECVWARCRAEPVAGTGPAGRSTVLDALKRCSADDARAYAADRFTRRGSNMSPGGAWAPGGAAWAGLSLLPLLQAQDADRVDAETAERLAQCALSLLQAPMASWVDAAGVDPHTGNTLLHEAVARGRLAMVQQLLKLFPGGEAVAALNAARQTPLHAAVACGMKWGDAEAVVTQMARLCPRVLGDAQWSKHEKVRPGRSDRGGVGKGRAGI